MLRLIVLLLLLANGVYYAWSQGLLLPWGSGPVQQAEPQRIAQQIQPETIRVLRGDEAGRLDTAAATSGGAGRAPECLAAGPFDEGQAGALRTALAAWPPGSWTLEPGTEPARWIVYMGKYASAELLERKKAELRRRGVSFEALGNPALEPGLSLGGFATQAEAERQLAALNERGVQTASVVQERTEQRGQRLQLPAVDEGLRPRLDELKTALGGKPLRPCR
jgi:hypothetical protein